MQRHSIVLVLEEWTLASHDFITITFVRSIRCPGIILCAVKTERGRFWKNDEKEKKI